MRARIVWAVIAQEVDVAHLELFDAFDFVGIVLNDWIDPLAVAVAEYFGSGFGIGGRLRVRWWRGCLEARCHGSCGPC